MPLLELRLSRSDHEVPLDILCAGFELGSWRAKQLVEDVFDRHLLSFTLNYSEYQGVTGATALSSIRDAATTVYTSDKYSKRGEFGEMLLHGALLDFYGAQPAVSKIFYEDSTNDVVKGFDGVHIVASDGFMELWLGEAKFYGDLKQAVKSATSSLADHLKADFLRREFMLITRKVDQMWPPAKQFAELIAKTTSLDDIISRIVMPVFVTYDSAAVKAHAAVDDSYVKALVDEAEKALQEMDSNLTKPLEVAMRLILVPIKEKSELVKMMHDKLQHLQGV